MKLRLNDVPCRQATCRARFGTVPYDVTDLIGRATSGFLGWMLSFEAMLVGTEEVPRRSAARTGKSVRQTIAGKKLTQE